MVNHENGPTVVLGVVVCVSVCVCVCVCLREKERDCQWAAFQGVC